MASNGKNEQLQVTSSTPQPDFEPNLVKSKRKAQDSLEDIVASNNEDLPATTNGLSNADDSSEAAPVSKKDKGKAKKRRKEEQRAMENPPSFSFDTRGFKGERMIQTKDVRDFVLHLLSDEKAQQWLYVANKRNVRRVVAVMVPGITPPTLGVPQPTYSANLPFALTVPTPVAGQHPAVSLLPVFQTLFSHACPTRAPGERNRMHSPYQSFLNCPLTGNEKDRREKLRKEQGQLARTTDPSVYLLSREQMVEQAYPEPTRQRPASSTKVTWRDWQRPNGWIEAPLLESDAPDQSVVLGIDCEMCLTEDGSELTRVSIVNMKGERIYDELVKPRKPILDYLTKYSGLNEEKLKDVTTRLEDVQKVLSMIVNCHTILIGHSLECDLRVLKLIHARVIDTSVIYQHPRGPPYKASLKWLAQKWLKREIQNAVAGNDAIGGHDSEEDARTCIDLLKLKMQKGPGFGEFQTDQETVFERIARGTDPKSSAVVDHGTPGQWHGAKAKTAIACTNDQEVLDGMLAALPDHDFIFGRFMDLSHSLGWSQPTHGAPTRDEAPAAVPGSLANIDSNSVPPSPPATADEATAPPVAAATSAEAVLAAHEALNARLMTLHAALPPLTALIVFTGHGDPRLMAALASKKARFDRLWKTTKQSEIRNEDRWMESDDRNLVDEVEKCRVGLSFYAVK